MSLQKRIKKLRKEADLTLEELADLTDSTKSYMWELENKPAIRPSARKIMDMAEALDTTIEYLMDGQEPPQAHELKLLRTFRALPPRTQTRAVAVLRALL